MKKSWGVLSGIVKVGHTAMVQLFQSEKILLSISRCTFALLPPAKPPNSNLYEEACDDDSKNADRQAEMVFTVQCSCNMSHVYYVSYQNSAGEAFRPIYIAHCKNLKEYSKYLQQ